MTRVNPSLALFLLIQGGVRRSCYASHLRVWRRTAAAAAVGRRFAFCWMEAVAVACWHALRSHAVLERQGRYEQALVSLKLKKSVDAEGGRTLAVIIEGG